MKSTSAVMSSRILKLAIRYNSAHGSVGSTFPNTPAGNDSQYLDQRKMTDATMSPIHQRQHQHNTSINPTSHVHIPGQPLPDSVGFNGKSLGKIRVHPVRPKVDHHIRITDYQFSTKPGRLTPAHSVTLYNQRTANTFDQVSSKVGSHAYTNPAFRVKPVPGHGKALWSTESLLHDLNQKQPAGRRQSGSDGEHRISLAEVVYRTEKASQAPQSKTVPLAPEHAPTQPPPIDIDRLSRDVWCQLEKRIRIERERHGRL